MDSLGFVKRFDEQDVLGWDRETTDMCRCAAPSALDQPGLRGNAGAASFPITAVTGTGDAVPASRHQSAPHLASTTEFGAPFWAGRRPCP
jgi:hypothetical protein